jgi:ABC-type oligopeptide transport system ATPase subunit
MRPCQNFLSMSAGQARSRVAELLETVGLTPAAQFAAKLPHQLSGGQRQRVLIARALACEPALIVADEPVSMLDVSLRAGVLSLLADLRRDRGLSLLYITHDLLSARVITDELLVLYRGQIVERGATKQVLQHPEHTYTKQLLGALANPFAATPAGPPSTDRSTT